MGAKSFRAFGFLTLSLDLMVFGTGVSDVLWLVSSSPSQKVRRVVAFLVVLALGIGLLFLRKWAAIYFSVPLFCFGLTLALVSIEQVPFPWNLLYMCEGISLMLPLIVTIRLWPQLLWGGKWFF